MPLWLMGIGDVFVAAARADALVVPVNCVGVAGRGLAAEARTRFPENFAAYQEHCRTGRLWPGHCFVFDRPEAAGRPRTIINAATKAHWRNRSEPGWIAAALKEVRRVMEDRAELRTLVLPALGCGAGGLDWRIVAPMVMRVLGEAPFQVYAFEPQVGRAA